MEEKKSRGIAASLLDGVNLDLNDLDNALGSFENKLSSLETRIDLLEAQLNKLESEGGSE